MENNLFRKKSLEHISSPEALHDYMRVTSPKLWMILGAVVILLVGFVVYASTAKMENTMAVRVTVDHADGAEESPAEGGNRQGVLVSCRLPISAMDTVKTGMTVRIGKEEGTVDWIAADEENNAISLIVTMGNERISLPDGTYDAELVLESTTPFSFLWN